MQWHGSKASSPGSRDRPYRFGPSVVFITPSDFDGASYRFLILIKGTATSRSRFFIQDVCVSRRIAADREFANDKEPIDEWSRDRICCR
jgi:hypothetical protein